MRNTVGHNEIRVRRRASSVSTEDPRDELTHAIELCEDGLIPPEAGVWALSARERAERLLETIDSMCANGQLAPTRRQAKALANIHAGACERMGSLQTRARGPRPGAVSHSRPGEIREGSSVLLVDGTTLVMGVDVSAGSPVGDALMGHVSGETVTAVMPRGNMKQMTIAAVDGCAGVR